MKIVLLILSTLLNFALCRDFIIGMFKKNDFLVASDTFYKEITSRYGYTVASYGRTFHCPITYFRVSDRLGVGRPPRVQITRGGLQKKYIVVKLTASYGQPIAVNIYVGCKNDLTTQKPTTSTRTTAKETTRTGAVETTVSEGAETSAVAEEGKETTAAEGSETPAAGEEETTPTEGGDAPTAEADATPTPAEEGGAETPAE